MRPKRVGDRLPALVADSVMQVIDLIGAAGDDLVGRKAGTVPAGLAMCWTGQRVKRAGIPSAQHGMALESETAPRQRPKAWASALPFCACRGCRHLPERT